MRIMNVFFFMAATCLALQCGQKPGDELWPVIPEDGKVPCTVMSKAAPSDAYAGYETYTVKTIKGFNPKEPPMTDKYGGTMSVQLEATGYFRVEKIDGRWWMVTPLGHPFIAASVGELQVGGSDREKQALASIFGTTPLWLASEMDWLRSKGFTAIGRGLTSKIKDIPGRLPYCVYTSPMYSYSRHLQTDKGYNVPMALPIVFEDDYEEYIVPLTNWLTLYAMDPFCIGIYTDNELFWSRDILDIYLIRLPSGSKSRTTAQTWLNERKGNIWAIVEDITDEDRADFLAYCLDTYYKRTLPVIRQYDSNHMYIGERFYSWETDLVSPKMMETAGRYMDVVSINHYTKWAPEQQDLENWENWSGRPLLISEFYVKGEDSSLPNMTGAGWVVPTQKDRGLFYQNFTISLIKSGKCVGWQWFKYQDNDPEDATADASNRDSNKGLVKWNYERYDDMVDLMEELNGQIYNLAEFYSTK